MDVNDEGGADRGEQTSLRVWSVLYNDQEKGKAHENQGGIEIFVELLHGFGITLHRLPFVRGVEIKLGVVVLDRSEVRP